MATYTLTAASDSHPHQTAPYPIEVREVVYDATKRTLAQNDIAELIAVAAGETVLKVDAEVLVVDANAGTAEIGDGADSNGYIEAFNDAALAVLLGGPVFTEAAPPTFNGYTKVGKYYAAADTIDFKALGASGVTTGKYRVKAYIATKSRIA
jgi:hypothetical protein